MASMLKQTCLSGPVRSQQRSAVPAVTLKPSKAVTGSVFRSQTAGSKIRLSTVAAVKEASSRWESQIKDGRVGNVAAKEVGNMMKDGWVLLDVRPPGEHEKVAIDGATHVPLFLEDPADDFYTLLKKASNFGMGGWWLGGSHMIPNPNFMGEVQTRIPKDAKVIVGCQKGLRSLAACEALMRAGYGTVSWVNGGFDACRKGDLPTSPDMKDIRYAGVGGLSYTLGWTEVQRDEQKETLGGQDGVIKFFVAVLAADLALFVYEYAQTYSTTGKLPWE